MTANLKDIALTQAFAAARERPENNSAWDELEGLAAEVQAPEPVAELYAEVLARKLPASSLKRIGERATRFCEEWFSDDAPHMRAVLLRVFELDPSDEAVFDRVVMGMTAAGSWPQLLDVYQRAVDATDSLERQIQLLDDAVRVAKDLANDADRAIGFLERLVPLRPNDAQLRTVFERLLERGERWRDLIALWDSSLDGMSAADKARLQVQIASCWLDKLKNAPAALDVLRKVLATDPGHEAALELTERVLASDDAAVGTRREALALLRRTYEKSDKPLDAARLLRAGMSFASGDELEALHRDAADIYSRQGLGAAALVDLGRLFALRPGDDALLGSIGELVTKLDAHARFVDILESAADRAATKKRAAELRLRAATVAHGKMNDLERAIALCDRVFRDDSEQELALDAGRALDALLEVKGRTEARVPVLERLARLEKDKDRKREVLGALAKLAGGRGDSDRAVATWRKRLDEDPSDREALDGLAALYEKSKDYPSLVEVLRKRASLYGEKSGGRDLGRIAQIHAEELRDLASALSAWRELHRLSPELVGELGVEAQLERSASRELERSAHLLSELGDAYRVLLEDTKRALYFYQRALASDPGLLAARAGLIELLAVEDVRAQAADALSSAYAATDEVDGLVDLLPHRLHGASDSSERARLFRQAATLEELRKQRPLEALTHLCSALIEEPANANAVDADLWRLAEVNGAWPRLADALHEAAGRLDAHSPRAVQLATGEGEIAERRLSDLDRAYGAYSGASRGAPNDAALAEAVCRTALARGRHKEAFEVVTQFAQRAERSPDELLGLFEAQVADADAYRSLCAVAETAIETARLAPPVKRTLLGRVAQWLETKVADNDGAETLLSRASRLGGPHAETLRRLAALERRKPGRGLFDTLMALADIGADDLDPLVEAASVARDVMQDPGSFRPVLERLFTAASNLMVRGQRAVGTYDAPQAALFAAKELADLLHQQGELRAEVNVLREAVGLPLPAGEARGLALRAARTAVGDLNDAELGVTLFQKALELGPQDTEIMSELGEQYDRMGRLDELLVLRRRELSLTKLIARKLTLRLDLARVMGELEKRGGRMATLLDNLRDSPGHADSLDGLERVLRERGAVIGVYDLFASQAATLEALGDVPRAAALFTRAAELADRELRDQERALSAYQKVAALEVNDQALEALARIRLDRHEPALALPWLERQLERQAVTDRVSIRLRLSRAYEAAGQASAAIECLAQGIEEAPESFELRDLLADMYRAQKRHDELAELLAQNASRASDGRMALQYAREAAAIFCDQLKQPERAIEVLTRAVEADPEDRALKCLLADGLTSAGRLAEAKTLLQAMVDAFGRRRSPERAEVHLRLARVAQAEGNTEEALSQLDTASSMDRAHVGILRELGELSQTAGQLDRAERAYRALLMIVRKPQPGVEMEIGASEVFYRLHSIAAEQKQAEKASELLESAVQTAAQSEAETLKLRALLMRKGEPQLLLRVLELRLTQVSDAASEAVVQTDLADVLENSLDRKDDALEARLKALACAPHVEELHAATMRTAQAIGKERRYVDAVAGLIEKARRKEDQTLVSDLALRAGSTLEHVLNDLAGAEEKYKLVEQGAPGYVEAQFALARVSGKLGHAEEERAVLERIVALPPDKAFAHGRRNARYRLVELQVQDEAARDEGLSSLETLVREDPDYVRAGAILQAACDTDQNDRRALELLEQIARRSDEPKVLLDFLERHARAEEPSLGLIREGAELAVRIKEYQRGEALLKRAIQIAEKGDGLVEALWAVIQLGRLRKEVGDIRSAMDWLEKAMHASDPIEGFDIGLELAALAAAKGKDPKRAARIYEALRERDPADRRVWAPLLELYRAAGDLERTLELVRSTLEAMFDPSERNALRLETARMMFNAKREDDGAALLHDVLAEEPDHEEATLTLADLYERRGENEALADLLSRKLEVARERSSPSLIPISLRMGQLLEATRPESAVEIYREALLVVPDNTDLQRATISLLDPESNAQERAELLERYLAHGGKKDPKALDYSLWLLDHQAAQADEVAFEGALAIAYRVSPGHVEIRTRLETWYRQREDWGNLVHLLQEEAERVDDKARSVQLLMEAAQLRLERLGEPSEAAALLRKAREFAPEDFELLKRAVHASAASGELGPALAEIDKALEEPSHSKRERVELLLLRSEVSFSAGMADEAVTTLDKAFAEAGNAVLEHLVRGLERARKDAEQRGAGKRERELTLRLVTTLHQQGDVQRPIELLIGWVKRVPQDIEALRALLQLLTAAQRWDHVIKVADALLGSDDPQVLAPIAERLVAAARGVGQPGLARKGLEKALERDPKQLRIVQLLLDIYQETGEKRALAELMMRYMSPNDPPEKRFEALRRVGQLLLDAGDVEGALRPLTQAFEIKPDDVPTVLFIADAHIAARRFQQAQDLLERAMNAYKQRRSPELASLRHRMAKLSQAAGDAQARLEWLNSAIEADMNNGEVASELAVVSQNMGQLDIALKALRAITMLKGDCPMSRAEAFYRQAVIVAQKGEPRRAVLWAKKAKAEDASFPGVDKLLAELGEG
jgi:tetratricopeptide (TPR) repeat protein